MYNRFAKFTAVADATPLWRGAAEALADYAAVVRSALPYVPCVRAHNHKSHCSCCLLSYDWSISACCTCKGKLALQRSSITGRLLMALWQ